MRIAESLSLRDEDTSTPLLTSGAEAPTSWPARIGFWTLSRKYCNEPKNKGEKCD